MSKQRYTPSELDARLRFIVAIMLGSMVCLTVAAWLFGLIFVTQPVNAQSENDKMAFNLLNSIATFATGTLAGLLIGRDGAKDIMQAQVDNKKVDSEIRMAEEKLDAELDEVRARLAKKPDGAMPEEQPVDTNWDKD